MPKSIAIVVFFLLSNLIKSQETMYISSSTHLYQKPDTKSNKVGTFARGAFISIINKTNNNWYEVKADNNDVGFVKTDFIKEYLNIADSHTKDPDIFINNDHYMGCPHLFVRAASLKAKNKPNIEAKSSQILKMNSAFCVFYIPNDNEAWINIGEENFIQKKYLGARFSLDEAIKQYNETNEADFINKRLWAERITQMGWLEKKEDNLKAQKIFLEYAKKYSNPKTIENIEFNIFVLENTSDFSSYPYEENFKKLKTLYLKVNGKKVKYNLSTKDITDLNLQYTKRKPKDFGECGYEADWEYIFENFKIAYSNHDKSGFIYEMDLTKEGNAFAIEGMELSKDLSEKDFILKFGKYINYYELEDSKNHVYRIPAGDAGVFIITFNEGKAVRYEELYYC